MRRSPRTTPTARTSRALRTTLAAALAIGLASGPALAASLGFDELDTDGDGALDREEVKADTDLDASFSDADTNADGTLSRWEVQAAREPAALPGQEAEESE